MPPQNRWPRVASALPEGTLAAGIGYIVSGISAYLFLIVAARGLGPVRYASLSGVWIIGLAGTAVMVPLEQEVARLVGARRVQGEGALPVMQRAAGLGVVMSAVLAAGLALGSGPIAEQVFDGERLLVASLAVLWAGYAAEHLARGAFAGTHQFGPYAVLLSVEALARLGAAAVLVVADVRSPVPYAFAIALAPIVAVITTSPRLGRGLLSAGPAVRWSDMSSRIGALAAASLGGQALMALPPLVVVTLSDGSARAAASAFFVGATVARVPLFLFSAVQASLLPKLAAFLSAGREHDFRTGVLRLSALVAAVVVAGVVGAWAIGPPVVRLVFGESFTLERLDLVALVAASGVHMLVVALCQALIAAHWDRATALAWAAGLLAFFAALAVGGDVFPRVERAFLAGELAALAVASGFVVRLFRQRPASSDDVAGLIEELAEDTGPYTSMSPQA